LNSALNSDVWPKPSLNTGFKQRELRCRGLSAWKLLAGLVIGSHVLTHNTRQSRLHKVDASSGFARFPVHLTLVAGSPQPLVLGLKKPIL
tara:strand:+ start:17377 stop:17646 length:270 start_codon:yes stop_codon:yes gene_type:complete